MYKKANYLNNSIIEKSKRLNIYLTIHNAHWFNK